MASWGRELKPAVGTVVTELVGRCGPPGEIRTCPKTCLIVKGKK
jgi:hypothetical protein